MAVEEHGGGKQVFRFRIWPVCQLPVGIAILMLMFTAAAALFDHAFAAAGLLAAAAIVIGCQTLQQCARATALSRQVLRLKQRA
jgi:hypothetical protein